MNLLYGLLPVAMATTEINRDRLTPTTPGAGTVAEDGEVCPIAPTSPPIDVPADVPAVDAYADTSANAPADRPQLPRAEVSGAEVSGVGGCVNGLTAAALGLLTLPVFLARYRLSGKRSAPVAPNSSALQHPCANEVISDLVALHRRLAGEFSRFEGYQPNACGTNQLGFLHHLLKSLTSTQLLAAHGQILILWPKDCERLEPKSHVFLHQALWEHHVVLEIWGRIYDLDYAGRPATAAVQYRAEMFGDQPCLCAPFTLADFVKKYNSIMGNLGHWRSLARDYVPTAPPTDEDLACHEETFVARSEQVAALLIDTTREILTNDRLWHAFLQTIANAVAGAHWTAEKTFYLQMRVLDGSRAGMAEWRMREMMNLFAFLGQEYGVAKIVFSQS